MAKKETTNTIKLTKDEIKELGDIRSTFSNITLAVGETEIGLVNLNNRKNELIANLSKVTEKQSDFVRKLEDKYGNGTVSVDTGEFTPTDV